MATPHRYPSAFEALGPSFSSLKFPRTPKPDKVDASGCTCQHHEEAVSGGEGRAAGTAKDIRRARRGRASGTPFLGDWCEIESLGAVAQLVGGLARGGAVRASSSESVGDARSRWLIPFRGLTGDHEAMVAVLRRKAGVSRRFQPANRGLSSGFRERRGAPDSGRQRGG